MTLFWKTVLLEMFLMKNVERNPRTYIDHTDVRERMKGPKAILYTRRRREFPSHPWLAWRFGELWLQERATLKLFLKYFLLGF